MPSSDASTSAFDKSMLPPILLQLMERDGELFKPVCFPANEQRQLNPELLMTAFASFSAWAGSSSSRLGEWLSLHRDISIRKGHMARIPTHYLFEIERLRRYDGLYRLATRVGVSEEDILYAFDVVLRYPLYGEYSGSDKYYLAHPIREKPNLPGLTDVPSDAPRVALSFSDAVMGMAEKMSFDEYTSFLHEARGIVRDQNIHLLNPNTMDRDHIRRIAGMLRLPARLNAIGKVMGITAGAIVIAQADPKLAVYAAIAGSLVTVSDRFWAGNVGRVSNRSWLRWAVKWDVESQAG